VGAFGREGTCPGREASPGSEPSVCDRPGNTFINELFPGLLLSLPHLSNAPGELPGEELDAPEGGTEATTGTEAATGTREAGHPADPAEPLGHLQQDDGDSYAYAGWPDTRELPGTPVRQIVRGAPYVDIQQFQELIRQLLLSGRAGALPGNPGFQEESPFQEFRNPAEPAVEPAGFDQLQKLLEPFWQRNPAQPREGKSPEGENLFKANAGLETSTARQDMGATGFSDGKTIAVRQWPPFLAELWKQGGPEVSRGRTGLEGDGPGKLTSNQGAGRAGIPVEITLQDGSPPVAQVSGKDRSPVLKDGFLYWQDPKNLPGLPIKQNDPGAAGNHFTMLNLPVANGSGLVEADYSGVGGSVGPMQIPALVFQVLQQFALKDRQGETHLRLKLEPEHLGEVTVRLIYRHGEISAHFLASSPQAKEAIESSLPQLREVLVGQNLHLQSVSVSVGEDSDRLPQGDYRQAGYSYSYRNEGFGVQAEGVSAESEVQMEMLRSRINMFI